jgi:hypothetical protein
MNPKLVLTLLSLLMLGVFITPVQSAPGRAAAIGSPVVIMDFNVTLEPGVWHGWFVADSSANQTYLVEVTPLEPSVDGACIERYLVQPEYNGESWADVLRIMIPAFMPPLAVNVRVLAVKTRPR